jgi:hemolysin D
MIRILLVDDQKTVREAIKLMLQSTPDLQVLGTAKDGKMAIEQVRILKPDVVLMDLEMPKLDGFQATAIIHQNYPQTKVLVLSSHQSEEYVFKALQAGATGYLPKNTPSEDLQSVIRFVARGYSQIAPGLLKDMVASGANSSLHKDRSDFADVTTANMLDLAFYYENSTSTIVREPPSVMSLESQTILPYPTNSPIVGWRGVIALLLLGVSLTTGIYWFRQYLRTAQISLTPSQQENALKQVSFTGKVEPQQTYKIIAPITSVVENVQVKVGDRLSKGQSLLSLKNWEADNARERALIQQQSSLQQENIVLQQRETARQEILELERTISNYQTELAPVQKSIATSNREVTIAQSNVDGLPLKQRQDSIERTQAIYNRAATSLKRMKELYRHGAISLDRVEQAQTDLQIAKSDLDLSKQATTANNNLKIAQKKQSQLQIELATTERYEAIQKYRQQLATARLQYRQTDKQLKILRQQSQKLAKVQQVKTIIPITASESGIVVELPVNRGDQIFTGNPLAVVANLQQLKITVAVDSQVVNALQVGQKTLIVLGVGEAARQFSGLVRVIHPIPNEDSSHKVEVQFNNFDNSLLIGQAAAVYFQ